MEEIDQISFKKTLYSYIILHFSGCRKSINSFICIASRLDFLSHQILVLAEFNQSLMVLKTLK